MKEFDIPQQFTSGIMQALKNRPKKVNGLRDFSPITLTIESLTLKIAKHFGFCFGVENAVEKAYATLKNNPTKRIYFLSEMIHNPIVNQDLRENGIDFIQTTDGEQLISWENIHSDDLVLIPAFGCTLDMLDLLKSKGIQYEAYDTTCPFVELVWKRSKQLSSKAATVIIHGKPNHEETKATFSNAISSGKAIVIKDMAEARLLGGFILNQCTEQELLAILGDRFSTELDIYRDFEKVGIVNQTTMLAEETQAIADYFKRVMIEKYGEQELRNHFEDTRDTLCYATNDNQQAMKELINESGDFALVIGGHNSSNTTHLVELAAEKLPTYFILNEDSIHPDGSITHFDLHSKKYVTTNQVIQSAKSHEILISAGASCPDKTVENVLVKLLRVQGIEPDKLVRSISALT